MRCMGLRGTTSMKTKAPARLGAMPRPFDGDLHAHGKADHDGLLVLWDESANDLVEVVGVFGDGVACAGWGKIALTMAAVIPVDDPVIAGELLGDGVHEDRAAANARGEHDGIDGGGRPGCGRRDGCLRGL